MRKAVNNLFGIQGEEENKHHTPSSSSPGRNFEHSSSTKPIDSVSPSTNLSATTETTTHQFRHGKPVDVTQEVIQVPAHLRAEVVKETIKPVEVREVQQVIDVHREQKEIHQVVQPVSMKQELPLQIHERTAPLQAYEQKETIPEGSLREMETGLNIQSDRIIEPTKTQTIERTPIVHEHIHKKVIEEIQPVIYRETIEPHVIKETVPIIERVVEAPTIVKEVRPVVVRATTSTPITNLPSK